MKAGAQNEGRGVWSLWGACALALLVFGSAPLDSWAQLAFSVVGLVTIYVLRKIDHPAQTVRLFLLFLGAFISLRYLVWRTCYTIHYHDPVSTVVAILLYLAELYGIIVYFLGIFVNVNPLQREPVPLPEDPATWPTVDIYVPTYNEPSDIIETTLHAAMLIRYPKDKFRVFLLDDGGTKQKLEDKNSEKAFEALSRQVGLKQICESVGVTYMTRERNEHAKAGNLNSAFRQTDGELVLILDTDHVPTAEILEKTVGWFVRDPKIFLVQTPHFFLNADPLEKNLGTFGRMPGEAEMFYNIIQRGLDFWNAAYFCGSAAVLRRTHLQEVGGIAGETITEDCETAIALHAKGYRSAYIGEALVAGLAPETFTGFVVQRMRWAQGMIQIFLLKNPLFLKGLNIPQRLCYFSTCFFWFFSYSRIMFLLAPAPFLLFGLRVYDATWIQFVAYGLPHAIGSIWISNYLFGRSRWTFFSELYELMQCVYTLPAIIRVFLKPRSPTFQVTPKGETLDQDYISPLAGPFYFLVVFTLVCIVVAAGQLFSTHFSFTDSPALMVTLFWSCVNLFLLLAAMGVLYERHQLRSNPRVEIRTPASLRVGDGKAQGVMLQDFSAGGIGVFVPKPPDAIAAWLGQGGVIRVPRQDGVVHELHIEVRSLFGRRGGTFLGLQFQPRSTEEVRFRVSLLHGSSSRWVEFRKRREGRVSTFRALFFLMELGTRQGFSHTRTLLGLAWRRSNRLRHRFLSQFKQSFLYEKHGF